MMTPEKAWRIVMQKFARLNSDVYPDRRIICMVHHASLNQAERYAIAYPIRKDHERAAYIVGGHLVNPNGERIEAVA